MHKNNLLANHRNERAGTFNVVTVATLKFYILLFWNLRLWFLSSGKIDKNDIMVLIKTSKPKPILNLNLRIRASKPKPKRFSN